jgi:hypothetical protein
VPRPPRDDDLSAHALHGGGDRADGDFLAHVGEWTGLPPVELLDLLRGTSPVSAGASTELAEMIAAIRKDPRAEKTPRVAR